MRSQEDSASFWIQFETLVTCMSWKELSHGIAQQLALASNFMRFMAVSVAHWETCPLLGLRVTSERPKKFHTIQHAPTKIWMWPSGQKISSLQLCNMPHNLRKGPSVCHGAAWHWAISKKAIHTIAINCSNMLKSLKSLKNRTVRTTLEFPKVGCRGVFGSGAGHASPSAPGLPPMVSKASCKWWSSRLAKPSAMKLWSSTKEHQRDLKWWCYDGKIVMS